MPHAVQHRLFRADCAVREHAIVENGVPEIKDRENDQRGYKDAHDLFLISPVNAAPEDPDQSFDVPCESQVRESRSLSDQT